MTEISANTSIHDLLEEYPFLVDFLVEYNPKFSLLKNPMMRATAGRVATLEKASAMGGVDLEELLAAIGGEVERRVGGLSAVPGKEADGGAPAGASVGAPAQDKVVELANLIRDLHDGVAPEAAKARFDTVIRDVSPEEIGAMEEQLIREGMPVAEIQRLCDLHVAVVQDSLDKQEEVQAPPGHPIHTYMAENQVITGIANRLGELCGDGQFDARSGSEWASEMAAVLEEISGIDNHYLRKENELFPVLEKHGITGPSKVMWGVHDEIRAQVKKARALLADESVDDAAGTGTSLARAVVEMVYKEEKILLPLAQKALSNAEWSAVRKGEDELGYAFQEPAGPFPEAEAASFGGRPSTPATGSGGTGPTPIQPRTDGGRPSIGLPIVSARPTAPLPEVTDQAYVDLGTGRLSLEQVDMMLRHLPIEISFVDAEGFVRYYSETEERLFPRTPGAIGRHVENCHPPKSVHMVKEILWKFAEGERDVAEFWIQMQEKFIHIRYFAVRNPAREYLGCLEVTQDVTEIRALEGQRRLLEWS
jgi:DUF438 domain-containing protein